MAVGQKYIPQYIDMDKQETLLPESAARYIKNLIHSLDDTSNANATQGGQTGVYKPLESNKVYVDDFVLPKGTVQSVGKASFKNTKEAFIMTYSAEGDHGLFRVNGTSATIETVYVGSAWNFQLRPEFFIHEGGSWLEEVFVTDPITGLQRRRTFLFFTEGYNDQRFICVEDAIATNGFNADLFPYFKGNYDQKLLISMGSPSPIDCISITEVPLDQTSVQLANALLYNTKQFRLRYIDVWGRPSEYGIISDMYIPGGGGCIEASANLPRCLDLMFDAPPPHINQVEIAYRNCNSTQWYLSDTLNLYDGSPLGDWWLRQRNDKVNYDANTGKITYLFCAEEGCDPIDPTLTNRLYNPLPITSQSLEKIGSYISLGNNKSGFNPISEDELNKIHITVTPPAETLTTARNIEIFVEVYNPFLLSNEPIFIGTINGNNKVYAFGGTHFLPGDVLYPIENYKQYFINPNQNGFVGLLAGTGSYVVSEQYVMDTAGVLTKVTDFSNVKNPKPNNVRYFQKFTFSNVNPQKYVFRIISHQTDPTVTPTYAETSTYVRGAFKCDFSNPSSAFNQIDHKTVVDNAKEIVIDVCDENYNTLNDNKILIIYDLTFSTAWDGYVKNTDQTTQDQVGIELLEVAFSSPARIDSQFTDHNGFYFVATKADGHGSTFSFRGYNNCQKVKLTSDFDTGSSNRVQHLTYYLNNPQLSLYPDYNTHVCNFILIKGKVIICGTNIGVPNVGVVLSRGRVGYTDNNGNFIIIAHDDSNIPSPRLDSLYTIAASCAFTDCNGECLTPVSISIQKCVSCSSRELDVDTTSVKYKSLKGLLSGGTYPVGMTIWDWATRAGYVQKTRSITMPSVYQSKTFGPSLVSVQIDDDFVLPRNVSYITFWIGQETTIETYVDWIVDSILFVDNTGLENNAAPTQIKIYYASLIEYNKQNNYNTTVNWSFLEALPGSTSQTPVITDMVQFLLNGDGTFFNKNIVSLVKYDQTGQYFLINYTPDLADLKANARIRLFRPKKCTFTEGANSVAPYFELCTTIKVVNGKPQSSTLILNAFDTYYVSRGIIPVPVAQNTDPVTYINEPRIQGIPFEHNSPSDFWGQGCANLGRVNSNNPQETVIYSRDQVGLSDVLSPNGLLNFLCFFETSRFFNFSDTGINGITAIMAETSTILVIGASDHFIVGFNDNLVRINADGTAQAGSIANSFGQPQRKVGQNWGCQLFDKNTIYKKEGLVHWLDTTKTAFVQHNYSHALNLAKADPERGVPGGVDSWLRPKIKEVQNFNLQKGGIRYFHGVVNPQGFEYLLSDFTIGNTVPVNNERDKDVTINETMAVSIFTKMWKGSYGFTPEMYTEIEGELNSQQLFSLFKATIYSHYNDIDVKSYGSMYGINLVRVVQPVIVLDNMLKKKPLSIGVICKQSQYFVDKAVNEAGQETRMLLSQWLQAEYGWYAPFLCDLNTPFDPNRPAQTGVNVLTDGNMLVGNYIKVRLIGDPAKDTVYSEFQGVLASVFADGNNLVNK